VSWAASSSAVANRCPSTRHGEARQNWQISLIILLFSPVNFASPSERSRGDVGSSVCFSICFTRFSTDRSYLCRGGGWRAVATGRGEGFFFVFFYDTLGRRVLLPRQHSAATTPCFTIIIIIINPNVKLPGTSINAQSTRAQTGFTNVGAPATVVVVAAAAEVRIRATVF